MSVTLAIPASRMFGLVRYSLAAVTLASAIISIGVYSQSVETCSEVLVQARASDPGRPVLLLDLPDRVEHIMCMGNALPAALEEPFFTRVHGIRGHATKSELDDGYLLGVLGVVPSVPRVERWRWSQGSRTFISSEDAVVWRGVLQRGDRGGLQVGGFDVRGQVALASSLVGSVVEVRGVLSGAGRRTIVCQSLEGVRPRLRRLANETAASSSWTVDGDAGEAVFLLLGNDLCCFGLGSAGSIGVATPRYEFVGVVGAGGRISVPKDLLANVRFVQAIAIHGPRVTLSEVRDLEE